MKYELKTKHFLQFHVIIVQLTSRKLFIIVKILTGSRIIHYHFVGQVAARIDYCENGHAQCVLTNQFLLCRL
jgi:hypothetical protein